MEKNELLEMINSTITTNGSGAITGEALNLALTAIVEAMGTADGGVHRVRMQADGTTTAEDMAKNAEVYKRIVVALKAGDPVVVGVVVPENDNLICVTSTGVAYSESDQALLVQNPQMEATLLSDGSIQLN